MNGYREELFDLLDDALQELYAERIIYDHPYDWPELAEAFRTYRRFVARTGQVGLPANVADDIKKIGDSLYILAFTPLSAGSIPGLSDIRHRLTGLLAGEFSKELQDLNAALDGLLSGGNPCYDAMSATIAKGDGDDTFLMLRSPEEIDLVEKYLEEDSLSAQYLRDNLSARTAGLYKYGLLFALPEYFAFHRIDKDDRPRYMGWLISAPPCKELHIFHLRMFGDFDAERYAPWPGYVMPKVVVEPVPSPVATASTSVDDLPDAVDDDMADNGADDEMAAAFVDNVWSDVFDGVNDDAVDGETSGDGHLLEQLTFDLEMDNDGTFHTDVRADELSPAVELGHLLKEYWGHKDD